MLTEKDGIYPTYVRRIMNIRKHIVIMTFCATIDTVRHDIWLCHAKYRLNKSYSIVRRT